jgi:hypothetical protein
MNAKEFGTDLRNALTRAARIIDLND